MEQVFLSRSRPLFFVHTPLLQISFLLAHNFEMHITRVERLSQHKYWTYIYTCAIHIYICRSRSLFWWTFLYRLVVFPRSSDGFLIPAAGIPIILLCAPSMCSVILLNYAVKTMLEYLFRGMLNTMLGYLFRGILIQWGEEIVRFNFRFSMNCVCFSLLRFWAAGIIIY